MGFINTKALKDGFKKAKLATKEHLYGLVAILFLYIFVMDTYPSFGFFLSIVVTHICTRVSMIRHPPDGFSPTPSTVTSSSSLSSLISKKPAEKKGSQKGGSRAKKGSQKGSQKGSRRIEKETVGEGKEKEKEGEEEEEGYGDSLRYSAAALSAANAPDREEVDPKLPPLTGQEEDEELDESDESDDFEDSEEEDSEEEDDEDDEEDEQRSRQLAPSMANGLWHESKAPVFPLQVRDLTSSQEKLVYPNWRVPVPIENDLFVGICLLKLRTEPTLDPAFTCYFEGKRRWMELQLQGRFKQSPDGTVFMGIEVPTPAVSMSFMTKQVANVMLSLLKRMVPDSHYSFGSNNECPHICFPLASAMDTFIETPEGELPPKLGPEMFPKTNDREQYLDPDPALRKKFKIGPIYTMSFHSMYLNLTNWTASNLPGGWKDASLESFWGDRPLRFVAYEYANADLAVPHLLDQKKFYFCFEIKHSGEKVKWLGDAEKDSRGEPVPFEALRRVYGEELFEKFMERVNEKLERKKIREREREERRERRERKLQERKEREQKRARLLKEREERSSVAEKEQRGGLTPLVPPVEEPGVKEQGEQKQEREQKVLTLKDKDLYYEDETTIPLAQSLTLRTLGKKEGEEVGEEGGEGVGVRGDPDRQSLFIAEGVNIEEGKGGEVTVVKRGRRGKKKFVDIPKLPTTATLADLSIPACVAQGSTIAFVIQSVWHNTQFPPSPSPTSPPTSPSSLLSTPGDGNKLPVLSAVSPSVSPSASPSGSPSISLPISPSIPPAGSVSPSVSPRSPRLSPRVPPRSSPPPPSSLSPLPVSLSESHSSPFPSSSSSSSSSTNNNPSYSFEDGDDSPTTTPPSTPPTVTLITPPSTTNNEGDADNATTTLTLTPSPSPSPSPTPSPAPSPSLSPAPSPAPSTPLENYDSDTSSPSSLPPSSPSFSLPPRLAQLGYMDKNGAYCCTVIHTTKDLRMFGKYLKERGLKVQGRSLKKLSQNGLNTKRIFLSNKLRELAGLQPLSTAGSAPVVMDSEDQGSSDEEDIQEAYNDCANAPFVARFWKFLMLGESHDHFWSRDPWALAGFDVHGNQKESVGMYSSSAIRMRGILVKAQWETHWMCNWALLSPTSLLCFEISNKKTPKSTILLRDIVQVKALLPKSTRVPGIGDDTPPFSGVYFFKVETKRNSVSYFFVRTKEERDEWIAAIETAVNALKKETVSGTHTQILNRSTQPIDNDSSDESDDDFDSFSPSFPSATASTSGLPPKTTRKSVTMGGVTKAGGGGGAGRGGEVRSGTPPSAMKGGRRGSQPQQPGLQRSVTDQQFQKKRSQNDLEKPKKELYYRKVGKRKVLNGRRLSFQAPQESNPLYLSSTLLTLALSLRHNSAAAHFASFEDMTNFLKPIDLTTLQPSEKTAFFLNLFHTLLLHALFVLGPPPSDLRRWHGFFQRVSYECGGHMLSLAEIEHNILRAKSVRPKLLWAIMPKGWERNDPRRQFALTRVDPRVDVLLNYGSRSCPPLIPKFAPGDVEEQLDEAVAKTLDLTVQVDTNSQCVFVSKTLYWYQNDFGTSEYDVLRWILNNGSDELQGQLLEVDPSGKFIRGFPQVKYRNFEHFFHSQFSRLILEKTENASDQKKLEGQEAEKEAERERELERERRKQKEQKEAERERKKKEELEERKKRRASELLNSLV